MQFYDNAFGVENLDVTQLDHIATTKGGVVGSQGWGYACNATVPARLAGGWRAKWIATQGMGNKGKLVLMPGDARTREVWLEGQVRWFSERGLSPVHAEILALAKISYRHELCDKLVAVLGNKGAVKALLSHPNTGGPMGSTRREWTEAHSRILKKAGITGLSYWREKALAEMVQAIS